MPSRRIQLKPGRYRKHRCFLCGEFLPEDRMAKWVSGARNRMWWQCKDCIEACRKNLYSMFPEEKYREQIERLLA